MTDFLIESSATMLLLLAIYRLLLEREKIHRFNRFYLLFALVFSLAIPFISFTIYREVIIAPSMDISEEMPVIAIQPIDTPVNYLPYLLIGIYSSITLLLAFRFLNNLMHFKKKIVANPTIKFNSATLVLLTEKVVPHTFLHYIFINRDEYGDGLIEEELFTHELAHVNQKHTIDILLIEVLKTIFWFNPLLYFYKKAIQLNHEFLADESVLASSHNVISYQQLLLKKALPRANYQLASSLNFSLTKKRFTMMTKVTPKNKALLLKLTAIPVIAALMFTLCTETVAQTVVADEVGVEAIAIQMPDNNGKADPERDSFYKGVQVIIKSGGKTIIDKPYEKLTEAEKDKYMAPVPQPAQKRTLSATLFESLKDDKTYKVSIDNMLVTNKELDKYKTEDFAVYTNSPAFIDALTGKPALSQYMLYTNNYYDDKVKNFYKKYEYDSYVVVTGHYVNAATDTGKPMTEPNEIIITSENDTVEKQKQLSPETEASKAFIMDERKKMQEEGRAVFTKRDSVKGKSRISIKDRNKKQDSMRAARKRLSEELIVKAINERKNLIYQEDKIYSAGEVALQPEFPGGTSEFYKLVNREFKAPKVKEDITARIYVSFVIETDGSMSNIKILRAPGNGMGEEAVRTLKSITTKWLPGKVEGKPVRTLYNLPIVVNIKS